MKFFEKYGKAGNVLIYKDKGFGFIHLETLTLSEIAKVKLQNKQDTPESSYKYALPITVHPLQLTTFLSMFPMNW